MQLTKLSTLIDRLMLLAVIAFLLRMLVVIINQIY